VTGFSGDRCVSDIRDPMRIRRRALFRYKRPGSRRPGGRKCGGRQYRQIFGEELSAVIEESQAGCQSESYSFRLRTTRVVEEAVGHF